MTITRFDAGTMPSGSGSTGDTTPRERGAGSGVIVERPPVGGGYPKFVDLGNGYTIVYTDAYDAGSIVSTKNLEGAGGGGLSQNTVYSQQQQNARDAADLAERQRQYDLTQGERKARGDQEQQLAEGQALGSFRGQATLGKQQLSENARQFDSSQALDYYKYLANEAANPRNFVENFFLRRGQPAPAGAAMYGNAGRVPASQFAPMQSAPQQAPQAMYPAGPLSTPPTAAGGGYASPYEGLSGFGQNGMLRLSPNDPDAAGLMAKYPGRYEMTSPEQAAKYLPRFAQGGRVHMTGPHALVDLRTGKPVAIAGEAGPETAYFNGKVITDPYADNSYDPYSGYVNYESTPTGQSTGAYSTTTQQTGSQYLPGSEPSPYSAPAIPTQSWTQTDLAAMIAAANAGNQAPTVQQTGSQYLPGYEPTPYSPPPIPPQSIPQQFVTPPTVGNPSSTDIPATLERQLLTQTPGVLPPPGTTITPEQQAYIDQQNALTAQRNALVPPPVINQPTSLPQNGQTSALPVAGGVNPRDVAPAGTFGGISGSGGISGARPQFLAGEDQSTLSQLQSAGIVPPFLQRAFAQSRGVQSQGTNQPFRQDFPKDVPLMSKIGWSQLNPDEQQAYLSYASSYGVTPEEYLAAIEQYAPHGGQTPWSQFGTPFTFQRQ